MCGFRTRNWPSKKTSLRWGDCCYDRTLISTLDFYYWIAGRALRFRLWQNFQRSVVWDRPNRMMIPQIPKRIATIWLILIDFFKFSTNEWEQHFIVTSSSVVPSFSTFLSNNRRLVKKRIVIREGRNRTTRRQRLDTHTHPTPGKPLAGRGPSLWRGRCSLFHYRLVVETRLGIIVVTVSVIRNLSWEE